MPIDRRRERASEQAIDNLSPFMNQTFVNALERKWRMTETRFQDEMAKLGTQKTADITKTYQPGVVGQRRVAERFGVSPDFVRDVLGGRGQNYTASQTEMSQSYAPQPASLNATFDQAHRAPVQLPEPHLPLTDSNMKKTGATSGTELHDLLEIEKKAYNIQQKHFNLDMGTMSNVFGTNTARSQNAMQNALQQLVRSTNANNQAEMESVAGAIKTTASVGQPATGGAGGGGGFARTFGVGSYPNNQPPAQLLATPAPPSPDSGSSKLAAFRRGAGVVGGATTGIIPLITTVLGAIGGGIVGRFLPGVGIGGGIAGGSLGGQAAGNALEGIFKLPSTLQKELQSGLDAAQMPFEYERQRADLAGARGFDKNALYRKFVPREGDNPEDVARRSWMKTFGADALGVMQRIQQSGLKPQNADETERLGKFFYNQESQPGYRGLPQGTVEDFTKTITAMGFTGGKITEGNTVLAENSLRKLGDTMMYSAVHGFDQSAVLGSINEAVKLTALSGTKDEGMLALMEQLTKSGMPGAGTGQLQMQTAMGLVGANANIANDKGLLTLMAPDILKMTTHEDYEKMTGQKYEKQSSEQQKLIDQILAEKNPAAKLIAFSSINPPSALPNELIKIVDRMLPKMDELTRNVIVSQNANIPLTAVAALRQQTSENPEERENYYKKRFDELKISPEVREQALGPSSKKPNLNPGIVAAALSASKEYQGATTPEDKAKIEERITTELSKSQAPSEAEFIKALGDEKQGKDAYKTFQDITQLPQTANEDTAEAMRLQMKLATDAVSTFTDTLTSANKKVVELEERFDRLFEPKSKSTGGSEPKSTGGPTDSGNVRLTPGGEPRGGRVKGGVQLPSFPTPGLPPNVIPIGPLMDELGIGTPNVGEPSNYRFHDKNGEATPETSPPDLFDLSGVGKKLQLPSFPTPGSPPNVIPIGPLMDNLGVGTPNVGEPETSSKQHTSSSSSGMRGLAAANNNPGNLRFAFQSGATVGKGGFAKFDTPEEGYAALKKQIELDKSRKTTVGNYIKKYAPPSENDTATYIAQATKALGVQPNTLLSDVSTDKMAEFQAMKESHYKTDNQSPDFGLTQSPAQTQNQNQSSASQSGHGDSMMTASNSVVTFSTHVESASQAVDNFVKKLNSAGTTLKPSNTATSSNLHPYRVSL